jgi:nitronate monooxygenase
MFKTALPIIQAPMAGVQGSALAIAVSKAGGLGSLPCAMLTTQQMRDELQCLSTQTLNDGQPLPYNVNFFCHVPPTPDAARDAAWRALLSPYYAACGLPIDVVSGAARVPFGAEHAELLAHFKPPVVSFHFGLPKDKHGAVNDALLAQVGSWGSKILCSATTLAEAKWLAARGVDGVIAQGLEAGGHRGIFLNPITGGD